ncbi:MAG: DUF2069 domain-containing protein, partial [Rudaea sp.]
MNPPAGKILRLGLLAAIALLALQIVWHAWLAPPGPALLWPALALALVPLLPGLWAARESPRRGVLICAIVSLFYFCHGIAELWSGNAPRWLAIAEILLSLILIGASGWDARGYKRAKKPAAALN